MPDQKSAPVEMVVLQGTPFCNLNCSYCDLSVESRKRRTQMPLAMIEHVFRSIFTEQLYGPRIAVVWHSGEPLTLPPSYYEAAIELITQLRDILAPGKVALEFDFQTNAVLINQGWIAFFNRHRAHMRLGVSCDGPASLHDAFRNNWGGKPTHAKVVAGMRQLAEAGLPFKIISVVTDRTLEEVDAFVDFILDWAPYLNGFHFNILADAQLAATSGLIYSRNDRDRYYAFYRKLLTRAREIESKRRYFCIQNFAQAMSRILSEAQDSVASASMPIRTINVDAEGYVSTFYAGLDKSAFADRYGDGIGLALGQITQSTLSEMLSSAKFRAIRAEFQASQRKCRKTCDYYGICSGGFELSQLSEHGGFSGGETTECLIIVKTLADAMLDDLAKHAVMDQAAE